MNKKDLLLKGVSLLLDLTSAFILPHLSDKIKDMFNKREQRNAIRDEVRTYLEAH